MAPLNPADFETHVFDSLPVVREMYTTLVHAVCVAANAERYTNPVQCITSIMGLVEQYCGRKLDGEQKRELVLQLAVRVIQLCAGVMHLDAAAAALFATTSSIDWVIRSVIDVSRGHVFAQLKRRCCL